MNSMPVRQGGKKGDPDRDTGGEKVSDAKWPRQARDTFCRDDCREGAQKQTEPRNAAERGIVETREQIETLARADRPCQHGRQYVVEENMPRNADRDEKLPEQLPAPNAPLSVRLIAVRHMRTPWPVNIRVYVNRKLEMTWPPIYSERPRSGDCNVWRLLTIREEPEERELTLARDVSPAPRGARGPGAGSRSRPGRGRRCAGRAPGWRSPRREARSAR